MVKAKWRGNGGRRSAQARGRTAPSGAAERASSAARQHRVGRCGALVVIVTRRNRQVHPIRTNAR